MSGGAFDYHQDRINYIVERIEEMIAHNNDSTENDEGEQLGYGFNEETIQEFKVAVQALKKAFVYAQRIDWLVSGDDGEDSFHKRLKQELAFLENENA